MLEDAETHITWEIFKMHFYKKYFAASMSNMKKLEFMSLHHRTMNVAKYTAKFEELCKFSMIYQRNPNKQ